MITNNSILVTGGAGFIGSHLCEYLSKENEVTAVDSLRTGRSNNLAEDIQFIEGSITQEETVQRAVSDKDIVIHLAGLVGVRRTLENPIEVFNTNLQGTRYILEAAVRENVDRFVFSSTSEVYGDHLEVPYAETDRIGPKTDYAVTKLADERMIKAFSENHGFNYTILRYFNVYGPRQDSSEYGHVIPIFIKKAINQGELEVHGDGSQTRDFTYIDDAVRATVNAIGPAGANQIFNIGTGVETQIQELAETVVDVVGSGTVKNVKHPRPYTVERRCADISRIQEHTGYSPKYSLHKGIERTAEYLQ
jgi:UDP-glucose 4-epimerase